MSVRERIYDAKILWEAGRLEGAVIQILIAFAATVRKRYPKKSYHDNVAMKAFILEDIVKITNGPRENVAFYHDGKYMSLESFLYTIIRCKLVHEGCLPDTMVFTLPEKGDGIPKGKAPDGNPYDCLLMNHLKLEDVTGFPIGWIWNLIRVVAEAPENKNDFEDCKYPLPDGYSINAGIALTYPDEHPERFPPNAPPLQQEYLDENAMLQSIIANRKR